jgi:hypothetical protein
MKTQKNRKFNFSKTLKGGSVLGEGSHGKVYNVSSQYEDDLKTIYNKLKKNISNIQNIKLHTKSDKSEIIIEEKDDIEKFINYLKNRKRIIGKYFKPKYFVNVSEIFETELESTRNVIKYYKNDLKKYTTIEPLTYKSIEFYGITVNYSNSKMYILFQRKCESYKPTHKTKILKMTQDILESISILQKNHKTHNDLKMNNMVYCNGTYKLIDWGNVLNTTFDKYIEGSGMTSSPIKFYIFGYSQYISKQFMYYTT